MVDEILHYVWDPIGVAGEARALKVARFLIEWRELVRVSTSMLRSKLPPMATPYIGDFDVVVAGGGASITVQQQEKTR